MQNKVFNLRLLFPVVVVCLILTTSTGCITTVSPGHLGVKTNKWSGKISPQPLAAGTHFVWPGTEVYPFTTSLDELSFDNLVVYSKEGQKFPVDLSIYIQPPSRPDKIVDLYKMYLRPYDNPNDSTDTYTIKSKWNRTIKQAAAYAFAQFTITELYHNVGSNAAAVMKKILVDGLKDEEKGIDIDGLGDDGVKIQSVAVSDIQLPDTISRSIELKAEMDQKKLAADAEVLQKKAEAEVRKAEASGEAAAKLIRAKAEGDAIKLRGLSPEQYVVLKQAEIFGNTINPNIQVIMVPSNTLLDARDIMSVMKKVK